eukprot:2506820-Rhodomonas_salina.1
MAPKRARSSSTACTTHTPNTTPAYSRGAALSSARGAESATSASARESLALRPAGAASATLMHDSSTPIASPAGR